LVFITTVSTAKTAKPIEMPFGEQACVAQETVFMAPSGKYD